MNQRSQSDTRLLSQYTLVATKLHRPCPSRRLVPRPRLKRRLSEGLEHKLTLISAFAGAGKTTLLCEWSESPHVREVPLIWVSLDEGDNDPSRFWGYVCAALQPLHSGVSDLTPTLLQGPAPPPMNYVLTTLINMLATVDHDFVLVLDDYHVINTPSIHQDVTFLLDRLPQLMHVFLLTRSDPPLPLARLRGRGRLLELRAADLRCTIGEAGAFLNDVMGLQLTAEQVAALEVRMEGWMAGLQLAALSMRGRNDMASFIKTLDGSHRFILEYLTEEVLQQQPEPLQTFLLQTSILERLSDQLCNALTERSDGQHTLEQIERANLFLIPLDEERIWYRYHALFAEYCACVCDKCRETLCRRCIVVRASGMRSTESGRKLSAMPSSPKHRAGQLT